MDTLWIHSLYSRARTQLETASLVINLEGSHLLTGCLTSLRQKHGSPYFFYFCLSFIKNYLSSFILQKVMKLFIIVTYFYFVSELILFFFLNSLRLQLNE